jgi:hypothetical protein
MIKAFLPADFAPKKEEPKPEPKAKAAPATIDLKGQSFLFTGKLATMQRGDATKKVTAANGKNASSVNAKLDYLVIGDEGSPLYGAGRRSAWPRARHSYPPESTLRSPPESWTLRRSTSRSSTRPQARSRRRP